MKTRKWILAGSICLTSLFTACQNAENPARPSDAQKQPVNLPGSVEPGRAEPAVQVAPEGRAMTESEIAEMKANLRPADAEAGDFTSVPPGPVVPKPLAKAAAGSCTVNFNNSSALSWIPEQAWTTFVVAPYYIQPCANGYDFVYTKPLNMDHYHLGFEFTNPYCFGAPYKVGKQVGANCTELKDAKLWPRSAQNMQFGSGIEFSAREGYKGAPLKLFDLKSLSILSGPAIIKVYRTDISSWWQWELPAAWWTFPYNSTNLRYLQIFHKNYDGIFSVDDIVVNIR